jgi:hypothetical protein
LFNIVDLSELWDQNDEEVARPNFSNTRAPPPRHQFSSSAHGAGDGVASADTFPFCLSSLSIAEERSGGEPGQERDEKRVRGRRAHFTIGKTRILSFFFLLLLKVHLYHFSRIKSHKEVTKQ